MNYLIIDDRAYSLNDKELYLLSSEKESDIYIPIDNRVEIKVFDSGLQINNDLYEVGCHKVELTNDFYATFMIFGKSSSWYLSTDIVYMSSKVGSTIVLPNNRTSESVLTRIKGQVWKFSTSDTYFVNGMKCSFSSIEVGDYDQLLLVDEGVLLWKHDQVLTIVSLSDIKVNLSEVKDELAEDRGQEFHRSPRIILREPNAKINLASPPTDENERKQSLVKILVPPFAMIIFTGLMFYLGSAGPMMFMMIGMSFITIGTSIHSYVTDKRFNQETKQQKLKDYSNYLDTKSKELYDLRQEQEEALFYHYPDMSSLLRMADITDRRIYEKSPYHFDYLTYRIGLGDKASSFTIDYTETAMTKYNREAYDKVISLLDYHRFLSNVPVINVVSSPIGYLGHRQTVIEQVQQLVIQLATFHSYHEVQFIPIFREEELEDWAWMRWLPHAHLSTFNSRSFIYNQQNRDRLLTGLYQLIKERLLDVDETQKEEKRYLPSYIFLITDLSLLLDHNIIEYINQDLSYIGIHYIFVEEVLESLPEHIQTVIDFRRNYQGILLLQQGTYLNKTFLPSSAIPRVAKERFARQLAGINHVQTLRNAIPEKITFLEMYDVNVVEELRIAERWSQNETYQTMAVPIGVRGRDDILYLNLHEKAHGPHGLIAGTTGSGKSELVQSYILSLAVNYHPYEVAFLLIDYKGGGMANLFAHLPHVVGTITNLDGNQANRALVSINAELKKRQRIFQENNVNHINQYTKLFKEGKVSEPLPHLLIISDEFAELKANQPDFMDELVSTARIGRSLGVKLILATQKPSGVVNDQIWSNSKFKIALKVQDVADSREVLKTPDAAEITQTGRAYLQVGNNEIYELFQSAWSGAEYNPAGRDYVQHETTVYEITDNGQYHAINKDLSGLSTQGDVTNLPTELDAVVDETHRIFENQHLPKVASPWLPPLAERVLSTDLQETGFNAYWRETTGLKPLLVGYQDIPEKQEQSPLYFDMDQIGHILLVSSPGFGKSTFLQTLAVDAMRKHSPAEVHFYLYDFGTSGLISLSDFPHVADYFALDETEKILKSMRRLKQMVKERKKALSKLKATNLRQYNQLSETSFPTLFVMIDGFDSVMDAPFADAFYDVLNVIARDGASLGIYLVTTLSRLNSMRLQLQSNFKTKISLFLFDNSDLSGVVGRSNIPLDEIKGRAITKLDEIVQFQVTLPYTSEAYADYIIEVGNEVEAMTAAYTGDLPSGIPMLPEKVKPESIDLSAKDFVFGLDREWVQPAGFSFEKPILMAAEGPSFINNYYKILDFQLKRLSDRYNTVILDNNGKVSNQLFDGFNRFTSTTEVSDVLQTIISDLKERVAKPQAGYQHWLVLIPDLASTGMSAGLSEADLKLLLVEGPKYGVTPLFVGSYQDLVNNSYDSFVKLMLQLVEQVFLGVRISDQNHTRYPYINNEPALKPNQGYILYPEGYEFVQLMEI